MAHRKKQVAPGLELARSDTKRIKRLSDMRDKTAKEAKAQWDRYSNYEGDFAGIKKIEDDAMKAQRAADEAKQDLESAPFEFLKLLQAAERKHGKPFRKKKKSRGVLLTKEAAERLLKIIQARRRN